MGFDGEFYKKDGKSYERITSIINYFVDPKLVDYRVKVGNRVANAAMKKAGNFGSMVDEAIRENWQSPTLPKPSPEGKQAIKAWQSWLNNYTPVELEFPETMFCDKLLVAGTPDFILEDNIIDIKCSSSVKPVYFAQLGGYAYLQGLLKRKIGGLGVLRLDKQTGMYEFVIASAFGLSVEDCVNYFLSLVYSYRTFKSIESQLKGKGEIINDDCNS